MIIENMTDQQIIDFIRQRGTSSRTVARIHSYTLENFFKDHSIQIFCPDCGASNYVNNGYNGSGISRRKCKLCGKSYAITTNTIFDGTSYTLDDMLNAIMGVISWQPEVNVASNMSSVSKGQSSVWLLIHKILYILNQMSEIQLSGVIQIDEKYFRETQKGSRELSSFIDPSQGRRARHHKYRSECGIFGPEFVNTVCAVDSFCHYWAKCICLGPMDDAELDKITNFHNVSYICSDNYDAYSVWCKRRGYKHYVEPSTYRRERTARGYINTDDIYHSLTEEEYAKDEAINRQMYKEGKYPYIEFADHEMGFDEFNAVRNKFGLGINKVNSFHAQLERYLVYNARGVSSEYLQDYVGTFVYLMNYKTDHYVRTFKRQDAEQILASMIQFTMAQKHSPDINDIKKHTIDQLPRPSKRSINEARRRIKAARNTIIVESTNDKSAYEGDGLQYAFNKTKFFQSIGTTRLNELAKQHGVYDRKEHKAERIKRMSNLPNAQDVIFNEIFISRYGSITDMQEAFNALPKKRKRGRPKKLQP